MLVRLHVLESRAERSEKESGRLGLMCGRERPLGGVTRWKQPPDIERYYEFRAEFVLEMR